MVREFLQNAREKFKPTWRTIVDAAFDINPALAKEIAEKHPGRFVLLYKGLVVVDTHYLVSLACQTLLPKEGERIW